MTLGTNDIKYSKKIISRIIGDDGEERIYKTNKLGTKEVSLEGFKILRALTPSAGVAVDAVMANDEEFGFEASHSISGMLQLLSENLSLEHYSELVDKLLGCLIFNGKILEDWSEHFDDHPGDFLEVLSWIGKETFTDFFMQSTILKPWLRKITEVVLPKMKEKVENVLNDSAPDSNEE